MHKEYVLRKEGKDSPWILDFIRPEEALLMNINGYGCIELSFTDYYENKRKIQDMMRALTSNEYEIIAYRFGYKGEFYSSNYVGEQLGLTASQVLSIEKKIIRKLRHPYYSKTIKPRDLENSLFTSKHDIDIKGWIIKEITDYLCARNKNQSTFWEEIVNKNSIQIVSINSTGKQYEKVEDLELSVRTTNALTTAGIDTVEELRKRFNEEENSIREIAHFGDVAYKEVQNKLTEISAIPGSYDISNKIRKDAPIGIRIVREKESIAYRFINHSIESIAEATYDALRDVLSHNKTLIDYDISTGLMMFLLMKGHFYINTVLKEKEQITESLKKAGLSRYVPELAKLAVRYLIYLHDKTLGNVIVLPIEQPIAYKIKNAKSLKYLDVKRIFESSPSKNGFDYRSLASKYFLVNDKFSVSDALKGAVD